MKKGGCRGEKICFAPLLNYLAVFSQLFKKDKMCYYLVMAKIGFLNLDPAFKKTFEKSVKQGDRFVYSNLKLNKPLCSRKKKDKLRQVNYLQTIKNLWNNYDEEEQGFWNAAGAEIGMSGYNLFVQDTSYRIKNNIEGLSIPSILHQFFVGNIHIEAPATSLTIRQVHDRNYWVLSPVAGKKTMIQPVEIIEDFQLPLQIGLSYKSNLSVVGENPVAMFYAEIWHAFQGENLFEMLPIRIDLVSDWKTVNQTLSSVQGTIVSYNLNFTFNDVQGDLFFDNVKAIHSGQNWAIDSACNNINNDISDKFSKTVKNWQEVSIESGSSYQSIYLN